MNNGKAPIPASGSGFRGHDVLYVLSRHRWKVILLTLLGWAGGVAVLFFSKPTYFSESELLVKYVVESRAVAAEDSASAVRTPQGDNVMYSEIGILGSLDLAKEVADAVGPTNLVRGLDPKQDSLVQAAVAVSKGLQVSAVPKSTIIHLRFEHSDPGTARSVLTNLVASYLKAHARIHRSLDVLDDLQREADQRRSALEQTATELRRIQNELGVGSVEDARQSFRDQMSRVRAQLFETEAKLAEKKAALAVMAGSPVKPESGTNSTAAATNSIPPDRLAAYRSLRIRADDLNRREQNLLLEYTELSPFVQAVRQRIATNQSEIARLEAEYPTLAAAPAQTGRSADSEPGERGLSPAVEIPGLEARLKVLNEQLAQLRADSVKLDERAEEMENLSRRKQIEEKRYVHLATTLGQAGIDQALSQGRAANIRVIQQPTPASQAQSKILKLAGGLAFGGMAFALALAFGYESVLDQSVRRRAHVEEGLRLPLFLSIPKLRLRPIKSGAKALPPAGGQHGAAEAGDGDPKGGPPGTAPRVTMPDLDGEFGSYIEALRDRLIMHFESEGLERKPKLIGLTSCGHGSGVTTVATSLAASLSETGDGNVLYVDMNPHRGPLLHPFQRGESKVALAQAFEGESRAAAQVQENLYVVSLAEPGNRRVGVVPKALAALMPKMKASDYDYIIFDFPPVTQTSVTAKVTGLLDMTFLVLESERTHTDLAKNALALMGEGRAKVTAVLNKHRRYIPRRFDPDI